MADQLAGSATAAPATAPPDLATLYGVASGMLSQPLKTQEGTADNVAGLPPNLAKTIREEDGSSPTQYGTVGDALQAYYGLTPDQVAGLQSQLYGTPFWTSSKTPVTGNVNDPDTFDAYKNAVIAAARGGLTLDEVLSQASTGEAGLGTPATPPATRVYPGGKVAITETDPETIRLAANATAQKLMGRDLSTAEAQAVVDSVRSDEQKKGAQQAALDESQRETQIQTNEALYGQPGQTAPAATGAQGSAPQGKLTPQQRAQVAYNAGFRGQALVEAVAVSMSEGDVGEINDNPSTGDYSVGPWQINYYGDLKASRTQQFGDPRALANDPQANANAAFALSANGTNFSPWSTYKNGAYKANLPAAQAAAAAVDTSGAGVPVQGVTQGGATGQTTDIFLQPTTQEISTPVTPEGAATQQIQSQDTAEMQEYGLQTQLQNFTSALHGVPGDVGATKAVKA